MEFPFSEAEAKLPPEREDGIQSIQEVEAPVRAKKARRRNRQEEAEAEGTQHVDTVFFQTTVELLDKLQQPLEAHTRAEILRRAFKFYLTFVDERTADIANDWVYLVDPKTGRAKIAAPLRVLV
jgi:hypothetical protein